MEQLGWVFVSGITMGAIYALVALGVVVVYSITKIFNLAAGASRGTVKTGPARR